MKTASSFTLEEANLLWLRAQAKRSNATVSGVVDNLITQARVAGHTQPGAVRSVVGTIEISADDPHLEKADEFIRSVYERSLARPHAVKESRPRYRARRRARG